MSIAPRDYDAEIAKLRAASKDAEEHATRLEAERDVRYVAFWDGYREAFGGTTTWEGLPEGGRGDPNAGLTRHRIRAGVNALGEFDRASGSVPYFVWEQGYKAAVEDFRRHRARAGTSEERVHASNPYSLGEPTPERSAAGEEKL